MGRSNNFFREVDSVKYSPVNDITSQSKSIHRGECMLFVIQSFCL